MMTFTGTKLADNIIWLDFVEQQELCRAFLRFQEYYEGPDHTGTIFTLEEYIHYYTDKYGAFTYYTDWNGFNIPSHILHPFQKGSFDPLDEWELVLLAALEELGLPLVSYIIGTNQTNQTAFLHEIAHALFYVDPDYRADVLTILGAVTLNEIFEALAAHEYGSATWVDEVHAYLFTHSSKLEEWGVNITPFAKTSAALVDNFNKHTADMPFDPPKLLEWDVPIG